MRLYAILVFLIGITMIPRQSQAIPVLDQVVLGSAGGTVSAGSRTLDFTMGEPIVGRALSFTSDADLGFWWSVTSINVSVSEGYIPLEFSMHAPSPNPFGSVTRVAYGLPREARVDLTIFNVQGRIIRHLVHYRQDAGSYNVEWDGRSDSGEQQSAGVYFVSIHAGPFNKTTKSIMLK